MTKVAGGISEGGIVVGNIYDKYGSSNPLVKWLMQGFHCALSELVKRAAPASIHEIGCGEGHWVLEWNKQGLKARGSDFSQKVIEIAKGNALEAGISPELFSVLSIYDLTAGRDDADLLVCCEVLEHLDNPARALEALRALESRHIVVSVPREPLWRILNLARGRYIAGLGNTPGHIQHWSKRAFIRLIGSYFDIIDVRTPPPWTMLLCRKRL